MEQLPLISVVVPIYKVEEYLEACVESILRQSYRRLEILLVDDGSPDRCPELADGWAAVDPRVTVIHKGNGGLSSARNAGLDRVSGEYVAFIDSDDWVEPDFIEALYQAAASEGAAISVGGFNRAYPEGRRIPSVLPSYEAGEVYTVHADQAVGYFFETAIAVWGKLYRRELIRDSRFIEGRMAEDIPFQTELLRRTERVAFCDRHLYNYRQRAGSIARSIKPDYLRDHILFVSEALELCRERFPGETAYCEGWLASLVYEFTAARAFGEGLPDTGAVLDRALGLCGGEEKLLHIIDVPESVICYTYCQFKDYLTKEERRRLQRDLRRCWPSAGTRRCGTRSFLKFGLAAVNLRLANAVREAAGGAG